MSLEEQRRRMVNQQLMARGIWNEAILEVFQRIPRHLFVDQAYHHVAYSDMPLPLPSGQTVSQPYIVAYMIQAAHLKPFHRVLEIGAGSGFAAAILSQLAETVHTVERHAELVTLARRNLEKTGCRNVTVHHGDGTLGWVEHAPYDAILVSASGPAIPQALREQLAVGGRLVMPVGESSDRQHLVVLERQGKEAYTSDRIAAVRFVPLVGHDGW